MSERATLLSRGVLRGRERSREAYESESANAARGRGDLGAFLRFSARKLCGTPVKPHPCMHDLFTTACDHTAPCAAVAFGPGIMAMPMAT